MDGCVRSRLSYIGRCSSRAVLPNQRSQSILGLTPIVGDSRSPDLSWHDASCHRFGDRSETSDWRASRPSGSLRHHMPKMWKRTAIDHREDQVSLLRQEGDTSHTERPYTATAPSSTAFSTNSTPTRYAEILHLLRRTAASPLKLLSTMRKTTHGLARFPFTVLCDYASITAYFPLSNPKKSATGRHLAFRMKPIRFENGSSVNVSKWPIPLATTRSALR
jgi:hypothetical protein